MPGAANIAISINAVELLKAKDRGVIEFRHGVEWRAAKQCERVLNGVCRVVARPGLGR